MVLRGCMENLWAVKGELKVVNFLWYLRHYVIPCKSHFKEGHNLRGFVWWKIAVFCSRLFIVCKRFHSFKTKVEHMKCFKTLCVIDDYTREVFACWYFIIPFLFLFLIPFIKSISSAWWTLHGDFTKQSTSRQRWRDLDDNIFSPHI